MAGILTYRAAGKLRAGPLRRHQVLLSVAAIAFLIAGIIFGMQFERMMHRAMMIRILPSAYVMQLAMLQYDIGFSMTSPAERERQIAELQEKIAQDDIEKQVKAAAIKGLSRVSLWLSAMSARPSPARSACGTDRLQASGSARRR